jgi:squalene-hopene/tetraprenyl-beta-curcumene cyclase
MKSLLLWFLLSVSCIHSAFAANAPAVGGAGQSGERNGSFQNEVQLAIDRGLFWLKAQQSADGAWSTGAHPALTALALMAFERDPSAAYAIRRQEFLQRGYGFLRSKARPDGGIYENGLSNYNTALCLIALLQTRAPEDAPLVTRARRFLIAQQARGMAWESFDGGIGYGPTGVSPKRQHPDLDNTVVTLEALRAFQAARAASSAAAETPPPGEDLDWAAAAAFVSRTQNLPETNPAASKAASDRGGFVYYPGFSNADPPEGPAALRSYGSMSCAGLLSLLLAEVSQDDQRVRAALEWVGKNHTLEENPGLGQAGLYYYYYLLAKGLTAAGVGSLKLSDGTEAPWAPRLGRKLLDLQGGEGSWSNATARWMERDPVLATCYSVLTLELLFRRL